MPGWPEQVLETIREEFSDLPDVAQVTRVTLRLLIAAILGGVLGYEREKKGKAAGVRTHILVALGAGAIIRIGDQGEVKGLTTAAGIWLTAAIGMAAGMGREATAMLCSALALTVLSLFPKVAESLERRE